MPRPSTLTVPGDTAGQTTLEDLESLVVIGANGSGKSRFGYAIEERNQATVSVQRIAAQRALEVPESVAPSAVEVAEEEWYFGRSGVDGINDRMRKQFRWRKKPVTGLLNDYERLMKLVFAKRRERDYVFTRSHLNGEPLDSPEESAADKVERVWDEVFPHRKLVFEADKVLTRKDTDEPYNAAEMSDGERVALYLMASVFVASADSVIIIDEPEIHLHRSIRDSLFDSLEAERADCLFVYLTHDVEFATSRPASTRIWLKEYTGSVWRWEYLAEAEGLPSSLVADLLGSRRPVLFVEGESGSLDTLIYSAVYPDRYVVPVGSCTRVIHFTKALNGSPQLHHLSAEGIIDRDRRTDEVVASLAEDQIHVLPVAEVENILLTRAVVTAVAEVLSFGQEEIDAAQAIVLRRLEDQRDGQVAEHVLYRVRHRVINAIDNSSETGEDLEAALKGMADTVDVAATKSEVERLIDQVIDDSDYGVALRVFNSKELVRHVAGSAFHLSMVGDEDGISNFIRRHIHSNKKSPVLDALRDVLPELAGNPRREKVKTLV